MKHDLRLARSIAMPLARSVYANIAADLPAKLRRRSYLGISETSFDPFDPATAANPYPAYSDLLAGARVRFNRQRNMFLLSRYEDVRAAARNDAVLSNRDGVTRARIDFPNLLNLDPPRHTELRRKVQPVFARGALSDWQSAVDQMAEELVGDVLANPGCDMVARLAVPLPVRLIAHILGIPEEDQDFFRYWSNEVIRVADIRFSPTGMVQWLPTIRALRRLHTYFYDQFASRDLLRSNSLLGRLVGEAEGGDLSQDELFQLALLLLLAGNETTTNLLSTMFLTLSQNPDQFEAIRAEGDAVVDSAVEEQVRYSSPVQRFYRTATSDYRVGGAVIPAGARVCLMYGAANRDPRQFEEPDRFIANRKAAHLGWGSGVHLCLGANLARMEIRAVLRELIERVERIEIVGTPEWTTNASLRGLAELRVNLHPR
ncbi:cytochrome P450 [Mycolicibacter algericus]|uniref:cytochrome P450 n=2 Tax=Mycobacteriaceae TaxID=1762 RepID=UPI003C750A69